jgi:hypothetical protein
MYVYMSIGINPNSYIQLNMPVFEPEEHTQLNVNSSI